MENEMFKLGFELALRQAGFTKTANATGWTKKNLPTFRKMLGFEEGSATRQGVGEAKTMMAKNYKRTDADTARRQAQSRPALQRNLATQPQNAYAVR